VDILENIFIVLKMHDTKKKIKEFCTTNQFKEEDGNRFVRYITPNGVIEIVLKEAGVYIRYRVAFVSNSENYKDYTINKLIYFNQLKLYDIEDINIILKNEILGIIKETYSDILFNNK
jgi:hypothetical protein